LWLYKQHRKWSISKVSQIPTVKFYFLLESKTVSFSIWCNFKFDGSLPFKATFATIGFDLRQVYVCKSRFLASFKVLKTFLWRHQINQMKTILLDRVINTLSNYIQIKNFSRFVEMQLTEQKWAKISESCCMCGSFPFCHMCSDFSFFSHVVIFPYVLQLMGFIPIMYWMFPRDVWSAILYIAGYLSWISRRIVWYEIHISYSLFLSRIFHVLDSKNMR
jgi:hypothetical protein